MELLYSYSFMKGSNYLLSNFPTFMTYGFISFRGASRVAFINSNQLSRRAKILTDLKHDDTMMYSMRAFSNNGVFNKLKKYCFKIKEKNETPKLALHLYRSIENVNFKEFYTFLEMADTFNSWFVIMELHLWMLLSQLMHKEKEGIKLRNEVVKAFWYDVDGRIHNLKVDTPKIIKKQLGELSSRLPITLLVYDEGLLSTDFVLAGGLWYKFFEKQPVDPRKLEILVRYIRYQIQHLSLLELKNYDEVQKISHIWLPVTPHVNAVMSQN